MDNILGGFDAYALDFPVCTDTKLAPGRHERYTMIEQMKKAGHTLGGYFPDSYQACASEYGNAYLNRADVQQAIGVNGTWSMCASINYNSTDVNQPMMPVWKELVAHGGLKIMIYSGDDDSVCATLGSQQFVWDLGLDAISTWKPWLIDGQTAGFKTQFQGNFDFVTVHGAGHMVPQTRPAQSLALITSFISGNWEEDGSKKVEFTTTYTTQPGDTSSTKTRTTTTATTATSSTATATSTTTMPTTATTVTVTTRTRRGADGENGKFDDDDDGGEGGENGREDDDDDGGEGGTTGENGRNDDDDS
eukprot:gene30823-4610_t